MGLDVKQFRELIVRPALKSIGYLTPAAEDLVMGTAAQESRFKYVRQIKGPALGIYQAEPSTHLDYWRYLSSKQMLHDRVIVKCDIIPSLKVNHERLVYDLKYATIMCRIHYLRIKEALPEHGDIEGYARYWKKYYNTSFGAGTEDEFIRNYGLTQ